MSQGLLASIRLKCAAFSVAIKEGIIELPFGEQTITVKWPSCDPEGCARFVRGLTS